MMGFNLFPDVLWWGTFLVPVLLRLSLSIIFISLAVHHLRNRRNLVSHTQGSRFTSPLISISIGVEIILAFLLLVGLSVQLASLLGMVYGTLFFLRFKKVAFLTSHTRSFYFLMIIIFLALFFTGAGPLAFDIPL